MLFFMNFTAGAAAPDCVKNEDGIAGLCDTQAPPAVAAKMSERSGGGAARQLDDCEMEEEEAAKNKPAESAAQACPEEAAGVLPGQQAAARPLSDSQQAAFTPCEQDASELLLETQTPQLVAAPPAAGTACSPPTAAHEAASAPAGGEENTAAALNALSYKARALTPQRASFLPAFVRSAKTNKGFCGWRAC